MIKNRLYMRAFSTILSVMTIFSGIYNSYGVKAVEKEVKTTVQTDKTKAEVKKDQPNTSKEENKTKPSSSSSTSSSKDATKPDAAIQRSPFIDPDEYQKIESMRKETDEKKRDEFLKLLKLLVNVLEYCNITKYKWDENDKEAISQGATQTLTEEQKSEICEMFTYVRSHDELFDSMSLSGSFVAPAKFSFGSSAVTAYNQLREICTQVNAPIPKDWLTNCVKGSLTWFGFSKDSVYSKEGLYDVRKLFLMYRIPRAEPDGKTSSNVCIHHALSILILAIQSTLNLAERLGYMPVNDLTVQLLHAWQAALDLMLGNVSNYVTTEAQPYIKGQGNAFKDAVYETADNLEKKMPNFQQLATRVQNIIQTAIPLACVSIVGTYTATKVISFIYKCMDKKYFGLPAEKNDRNELKQPKNAAQKSQQLHKTQQQTIAKNCPQNA